jgi:LysR family glycine cleavage system transcriptional activator
MASGNRNISLRMLRTFCAAAETESFREAAELLFLTSSAVSHQIKQLESELGYKLFMRNSRSLALTGEGRALFAELQPVLHNLDEILAKNSEAKVRRSLHVSVQPFFASEFLIPRLQEFVALHPEIEISLDASDESPQKHPDAADVSIRLFRTPPRSDSCDRLFPLCLIPAGAPELYDKIKVVGGKIKGDFSLIYHDSRPDAWRKWERAARLRLPANAPTIRFDTMSAVVRAAELGMGAALVPMRLCESRFETQRLVQLFERKVTTDSAYYLVCQHDDRETTAVRSFRKWVLELFAE